MKKRIITITLVFVAVCFGVAILLASSGNDNKPIRTIEKFIGTEVKESDTPVTANVVYYILQDNKGNYDYSYVAVENISNQKVHVLFLYDDDTSIIEATECKRTFVNSNRIIDTAYMNKEYHNSLNFKDNSFAYRYNNEIAAIMSEEAEFGCSSIWALDSSTNEVALIWKEGENSNS